MSFPSLIAPGGVRPSLRRSRSHTAPGQKPNLTEDPRTVPAAERPPHLRSQSYLSPVDPTPRNAITLPTVVPGEKVAEEKPDKVSRLHLPGGRGLHREHSYRKHRHTQSEAQQQNVPLQHVHRSQRSHDTDLPHLIANLNAERDKRHSYERAVPKSVPDGLKRMASHRSYRGDNSLDLNRSDVRKYDWRPVDTAPLPKTEIELDLERADRARWAKKHNVRKEDVEKREKEIAEAEDEMMQQVTGINQRAVEISRRLDYGYYSLLEKAGALESLIHDFRTIDDQSRQMLQTFDNDTTHVDNDVRNRIQKLERSFKDREIRVTSLEQRGRIANRKAEELGRRLEAARNIVQSWEKREAQAKRVWSRFWGGICWTVAIIITIVLALIIGRIRWFQSDPVKAGLRVPSSGSRNTSLALGKGDQGDQRLFTADLPDDVREILEGIEERNRKGKVWFPAPDEFESNQTETIKEDPRLKLLDEL